MVQAFDDVAPSDAEVTDYDHKHIMLYYCLLDRKERRRDWRETVQAFFGIDAEREPERAPCLRQSFGASDIALRTPLFRKHVPVCSLSLGVNGRNERDYRARSGVRSSQLSVFRHGRRTPLRG
jgi:hypothetical protein